MGGVKLVNKNLIYLQCLTEADTFGLTELDCRYQRQIFTLKTECSSASDYLTVRASSPILTYIDN